MCNANFHTRGDEFAQFLAGIAKESGNPEMAQLMSFSSLELSQVISL